MSTTTSAPNTMAIASDTESRSYSWRPNRNLRKTALFQLYNRSALLQHVRAVTIQQRGASDAEIDTGATLEDVPDWVLAELRADSYDVSAGGAR